MPKFKNSNGTFWVNFKQRAVVESLLTCWHFLHIRHKRKVCTLFVQRRKSTLVWMPCSVPLLFSLSMGRLKTRLVVWPQLLFLLQARMSEYRRFHSQSYSRCLGIQSRRKDGRYLIYHHNKTFSDDCGSFQPRKIKIGSERFFKQHWTFFCCVGVKNEKEGETKS